MRLGAIVDNSTKKKQDKMLQWPQMTNYLTTCRNVKICDLVHPLVIKTSEGNPNLDNHSVYILPPHIDSDPQLPNTLINPIRNNIQSFNKSFAIYIYA